MDLLKIINNKTIIYPLKSISKADAMQELLDYFYHLDYLTSTIKLFSYLDNHEKSLILLQVVELHTIIILP